MTLVPVTAIILNTLLSGLPRYPYCITTPRDECNPKLEGDGDGYRLTPSDVIDLLHVGGMVYAFGAIALTGVLTPKSPSLPPHFWATHIVAEELPNIYENDRRKDERIKTTETNLMKIHRELNKYLNNDNNFGYSLNPFSSRDSKGVKPIITQTLEAMYDTNSKRENNYPVYVQADKEVFYNLANNTSSSYWKYSKGNLSKSLAKLLTNELPSLKKDLGPMFWQSSLGKEILMVK